MSSDFEKLHDLYNEDALLWVAVSDYQTYQTYGLAPEDYFRDLSARFVRLAEAVYESGGQEIAGIQLNRIMAAGREAKLLSDEELAWCWDRLTDPPIGCVADPEKLKQQRRERELLERLRAAAAAVIRGKPQDAAALVADGLAGLHAAEELAGGVQDALRMEDEWEGEVQRLARGEGISLGLKRLKHFLGPLYPGAVVVVGAQTSNGKSSFAGELVLAAADDGTKCGYISMEDAALVYVSRWIGGFSGVSPRALHRGQHLERCTAGREKWRTYQGKLFAATRIGGTEQDVMTSMSVMARKGVTLIVVDYIGEVAASVPQQDRRNEIRWIVKRLKAHALRIGVALVLISQLTRPPKEKEPASDEEESRYVPSKHDLKEAGDIENAAEFVLLLWRKREHDFEPINIRLAKSKVGGTGTTWLMQREVVVEDAYGKKSIGSARLREVVAERKYPSDYEFPNVEMTYKAILAQLGAS